MVLGIIRRMKLELKILKVRKIEFGQKTGFDRSTLTIDRDQLTRLLLTDGRLDRVDVDLANPGDKCRIARVSDVIEPRARTGGADFPGAVGGPGWAGNGTTCVLRGAAVAVSQYRGGPASRDPIGEFIDMCFV